MTDTTATPRCFIAMPITTRAEDAERYGDDAAHWIHVMDTIFVPAIEQAGYEAVRPVTKGSHMIHGEIIKHLSTADMVLCDLSAHNPNVFFELGVRTALNLPVALVRDEYTTLPFDTSGLNTHEYQSTLRGWETISEVGKLAQHLDASASSCSGSNPLWRHFGLTIKANDPEAPETVADARIELILDELAGLRAEVRRQPSRKRPLSASGEPILNIQTMIGQALADASGAASFAIEFGPNADMFAVLLKDPTRRLHPGKYDKAIAGFGAETIRASFDEDENLETLHIHLESF